MLPLLVRTKASWWFAAIMFVSAAVALANGRELSAAAMDHGLRWHQLRMICIFLYPPLWLRLINDLVNGWAWVERRTGWAVFAFALVNIPVTLTWDSHQWFRFGFEVSHQHGVDVLLSSRGPWAFLSGPVNHTLGTLALALLLLAWRRAAPAARRELLPLIVASVLPQLFDIAYFLNLSPFRGFNPSVFLPLLTAPVWVRTIVRRRKFELLPVAHEVLFDSLPSPAFVLDTRGRLIDLNAEAAARTGLDPRAALGSPAATALPESWRPLLAASGGGPAAVPIDTGGGVSWFERSSTPLRDSRGEPRGTLVLCHDVTARVRQEREARELERMRDERRYLRQLELLVRDLHDGVGGATANIGMLAAVGQQAPGAATKDEALRRIAQLAADGSSDIRSLMTSLESRDVPWGVLVADMRRHGATLFEERGIAFSFAQQGRPAGPDPDLFPGTSLFRIYKEALTNIVKHSGATAVEVRLEFGDRALALSIRDNGSGLPGQPGKGRGLRNMSQRARELGGQMSLASAGGLHLLFSLPLPLRSPAADDPRVGAAA